MKRFLNGKSIIVLLLCLILFAAGCGTGSNENPSEQGQTNETSSEGTETTLEGYHEVKFALPAGISEEAKEKTTLPVTTMIKDGSLIYSMKAPRQDEAVFLGWYYDDALSLMAGPEDVVDHNMTLYPKFGTREDYEGEFSTDYVAERDVSKSYPVLITGHNLTKEEVAKLIRVKDTTRDEEIEFTVEEYGEPEEFKLENLGLSEEKLEIVKELVFRKEGNPDFDLGEALAEQELDEDTVNEILKNCAVDEWNTRLHSWLDEESRGLMEQAGISDEFSGAMDLNKMYGLEEGDSAARYWREELGFEPEEVLRMLEITEQLAEEAWNNATTFIVKPASGEWTEGHSHEVEILDTSSLRFFYNGEETIPKIVYHKFNVVKEEFNNIVMNDDMVYIPLSDVQGVESLGGLYGLVVDDDGNTTKSSKRGTLTYAGHLEPGTTVAIYDGVLNADHSVTGDVGYFKIAGDLGNGQYAYGGADITDVVFVPDVIPLADDGSFDDGKYTISADMLKFSAPIHKELGLDANTTVEEGDFVIFFTGTAAKTDDLRDGKIAEITSVKKNGGNLEITYVASTLSALHSSADMYMRVEQIDIPVEEIDREQLEEDLLKRVQESNFIEATSNYITGLIFDDEAVLPDDPDMADGLKNLTFATDTGDEISLDELKLLAGGASRVEISKPTVSFTISPTLEHFHGKGARAVVTAGFTISISMNGNNKLEIQVAAALEQEIQLGLDIDVDTEWDFLTLEEIYVDVALKAGTFTGFGGSATVMTKEDNPSEDKEWNALVGETGRNLNAKDTKTLLNMGETLGKMSDAISGIQEGGTVSKSGKDPAKQELTGDYKGPQTQSAGGDLPAKYSEMLENDAEYVNLVEFELFNLAASPDPFHLIEFSISGKVKIAFKVNAMIGFSLSYGNGREFGYHIKCLAGDTKQSNDYYEQPNFRVDFFVFGMLGLRAGIELDARVGLISTKFDSIGITADVGLYAELYGFLYMYYTWAANTGTDKGIMGSLLFEIGIYLEINFKAQLGDGKLEKEIELYSNKWPLLQLGATEVPVPYQEDDDEDAEALEATLEIPKGSNTIKVPDAVFGIDMMALDSGEVERISQDSDKVGEKNYEIVINGRTFTQYNEEHFDVTCYDLDGKDGKVTKNHSFQYLPATNEIYVKPVDSSKDELWGIVTFTYRNESFGFSTMEIKRTLTVHWKGDPCSATVEYYIPGANGYELVKEGSFDGFDGIEYDILVDDAFVYQFPGYRLSAVEFPDSEKQWDVVNAAYEEMHRLYDIYQKDFSNKHYKEWKTSHDYWNTLWNKANMYDWNIEQTIKNKKGTLYFLMVKNETVVRLYFKSTTRYVPCYMQWEGEDSDNSYGNCAGEYLTMGDNMYEKLMPDVQRVLDENPAYQLKSDFYVYFSDSWIRYKDLMENRDKWEVLTKDTVMKDAEAAVFVYYNDDVLFPLHWIDRGEVIRTDMLERWQAVPAPPETEPYPGYTHSFYSWTRDDGVNLMTNSRMEAREMTYTLTWHPEYQTVTWNVDGETWTTRALTDDLVVSTWPGTYRGKDWQRYGGTLEKEGYTLTWLVSAGDQEGEFNPAMKMPAGGVTLTAVYTVNSYNVVWKDGNDTVKEETLEFGTVLTAPAVAVPEGTGLAWQLDGQNITASTTVPGRDIEITASRHTHEWTQDKQLKAMNCNTEGEMQYKCTVCGVTKTEKIAIDPEAHNWRHTGYSIANCTTPQIEHYTCLNCGAKKDEENGEKDPTRHIAGYDEVAGTAATCGKDGISTARYCKACGELIWGGIVLPATGNHSWSIVANPAAACTENGTWQYTCSTCGATKTEPIPAKGHDWGAIVYSWADDHSTATATRTCLRDANHVETETVATTNEVVTAATCTSVGQRNYYAKFANEAFSQITYYEEIPMIPHIWGEPSYTWSDDLTTVTARRVCQYDTDGSHAETETVNVMSSVTTAPGCETTGIRTYTAIFTNSAFKTQVREEVVPATGHTWGAATYTWADDRSTVNAEHTCTVDGTHKESETVSTASTVLVAATCEATGTIRYTASFTKAGFTAQTKTETIAALGHIWGAVSYTWAADLSAVTAERVCANDASHKETEIAVTQSEVTKAPTYDDMGETTYTANFTNTAFATQTKTVTDVAALPEEWNAPTYEWANDYSSVTATRVRKDGNKTESETAAATGEITTAATCLAMGKTTYTSAAFNNAAFAVQTKVVENVPALGHTWGEPTYTWANDYGTVTAKRICTRDGSHVETETAITTSEITKQPTFDAMGETTYTANFTNGAFTTQTKTVANIDKVPEGWNAPTYVWADDYSSVTATRVRTDGNKTETETATATGEVTTAATCETMGLTTYTSAAFNNTAFAVQTKVVENVPALGHTWGTATYTWADDYSTLTAKHVCTRDASHVETETVTATCEAYEPATCESNGVNLYTSAAFANAAFTAQTIAVNDIPALGHSWGTTTYTWADDFSTVTAKRVCQHNANHTETESVAATGEVTTPATCEAKGMTTYASAAFTNTAFAVQTKVVDNIAALGHSWGAASYTWADDLNSVTAKRICANDASHVQSEQVSTVREVTQAATCRATGTETITATFTNAAFAAQTRTEVLPVDPDGHVFRTVTIAPYIEAPMMEGSDTLIGGRTVQICTLCGTEVIGDPVRLTPALYDDQLDFYAWLDDSLLDPAAGKTLQDVMDKLGDKLSAYITAASHEDGSGYAMAYIYAEYTWGENYSNVLLSDLDTEFKNDSNFTYKVKVIIQPVCSTYNGVSYDYIIGRNLNGSLNDLQAATVELTLTGHTHNWVETASAVHTDTEDGYVAYECSICHSERRDVMPAGHVWEEKYWLDDGEEELDEAYATRNDAGLYEDENGNHYDVHLGGKRYYCALCNATRVEAESKITPFMPYYWTTMNKELIDAGYQTVWDVDLRQYMIALCDVKYGDDYITLLVPGTFTWSVGQQSMLKSTTLESLKDPDVYVFGTDVDFTPDDPTLFTTAKMTFSIENYYNEYNHEEHAAEAMYELVTRYLPHWVDDLNGKGGWLEGSVYSKCSICGKETLDHHIKLPAYVLNVIDGTITAGDAVLGTEATIHVTAAKLIEIANDQKISYFSTPSNIYTRTTPWTSLFRVFYSDDGTLNGDHLEIMSDGMYAAFVTTLTDTSTLPVDTYLSALTETVTIEYQYNVGPESYAPVKITLVIEP